MPLRCPSPRRRVERAADDEHATIVQCDLSRTDNCRVNLGGNSYRVYIDISIPRYRDVAGSRNLVRNSIVGLEGMDRVRVYLRASTDGKPNRAGDESPNVSVSSGGKRLSSLVLTVYIIVPVV